MASNSSIRPASSSSRSSSNKKRHGSSESHRTLKVIGDKAPFQFNEAYKSLRTNLEFLSSTSQCKSIIVTSTIPEEGKSNVAVNLAMTLAAGDKKVILVDADLRKGTLCRYLKVPRQRDGLSSLVAGTADSSSALVPVGRNLALLTTGPLPPNPAEILAGDRMAKILSVLEKSADYVIIDTPPVSIVTDAAVLSRSVDGVILVAKPDFTTIQGIKLSKDKLDAVGAHILGVVLNGFDPKKARKKDGYSYSYSYNDYYGDHGAVGK